MFIRRMLFLRPVSIYTFNYKCTAFFQLVTYNFTNFIHQKSLCVRAEKNHGFEEEVKRTKFHFAKQLELRGKAATKHQQELISKFIDDHDIAAPDEWKKFTDEVMSYHYGLISELNIDGKIMQMCVFPKKLDLARSYLAYMKLEKRKFNGAVVSGFIKTCYNCRSELTEFDLQRIKQFTDYLMKRYLVFDIFVCDSVIKGLVLQDRIDEAVDLLHNSKNKTSVGRSPLETVAIGLLEKNDMERSKQILIEALSLQFSEPLDNLFSKWINIFHDDREKLEDLLLIMRNFNVKPSKIICDHLKVAFQSFSDGTSFTGVYGSINNDGKCYVCQNSLVPVEMSDEDFKALQNLLINNVLIGNDVFNNTTPSELLRFYKLVHEESPFDIIIDGLNVSYMLGITLPPSVYVKVIETVVQNFRSQGFKCFLIGRQHMTKWPNLMNVLKEHETKSFFIQNISQDDPFILYAAMYSGIQTRIVTRDLFRTEKYRLNSDKECTLFKRWHQSHQIYITHVSPKGKLFIRSPITFEMCVQKDDSGNWHIPYVEGDENVEDEYGIHRKWLCLNKKTS